MQRLARFLHLHSLILLSSFISLCVAGAIAGSLAFGHHLIETQALQYSKSYVQTIRTVWQVYHDDVIKRIQTIEGVTVTPQYKKSIGSIPTPIAYTNQLSQQLQSIPGNPQLFIQTNGTSNTKVAMADPFHQAAQEYFADHDNAFYQVALAEGYQAFNYAEPLIMTASCVQCHQTLINPTVANWKEGQTVGFIAIRQPLSSMRKTLKQDIQLIGWASAFLGGLGLVGSLIVQQDRNITQKQLRDEVEQKTIALERLDLTDTLTQVANQRQFSKALNQEWRRVWRHNGHLSLLVCDIDYFKQYNDVYGIQAGDQCLKKVAQAIQGQLKRAGDLVARIKADEFYILLPETNSAEAEEVAAILLDAVHHLKILHSQSDVSPYISISIGIGSTVPTKESHPEKLIEQAEKALYDGAKQAGRNDFSVQTF